MPCTREIAYHLLDLWWDLSPYDFMDEVESVEEAASVVMRDCAPLLHELEELCSE